MNTVCTFYVIVELALCKQEDRERKHGVRFQFCMGNNLKKKTFESHYCNSFPPFKGENKEALAFKKNTTKILFPFDSKPAFSSNYLNLGFGSGGTQGHIIQCPILKKKETKNTNKIKVTLNNTNDSFIDALVDCKC